MKIKSYRCLLLLTLFWLCALVIAAQNKIENKQFCRNYSYSNGSKFSFSETREMTMPAGNFINVDAQSNGNINVRGEDRRDVLVRACIRASGSSGEAARNLARGIRIETSGSIIRADSANGEEAGWSVSYDILVPRLSNLKLSSINGNINISSVEGTVESETINGEVHLSEIAGEVKGRTVNSGIRITLSGSGWKGRGLNVETVNGSIHLTIPDAYAARIESNTVNGSFQSNIAALKPNTRERTRAGRFTADLNGGGAPLRFTMINGNVMISSSTNRTL